RPGRRRAALSTNGFHLRSAGPLLFQNRFIIGYLKIIAQLIIVVDLQINQCKVSINVLAFSDLCALWPVPATSTPHPAAPA
ncbi:hypothetical protein J8J21_22435, partial [Mycobacterium tuberculosis]